MREWLLAICAVIWLGLVAHETDLDIRATAANHWFVTVTPHSARRMHFQFGNYWGVFGVCVFTGRERWLPAGIAFDPSGPRVYFQASD